MSFTFVLAEQLRLLRQINRLEDFRMELNQVFMDAGDKAQALAEKIELFDRNIDLKRDWAGRMSDTIRFEPNPKKRAQAQMLLNLLPGQLQSMMVAKAMYEFMQRKASEDERRAQADITVTDKKIKLAEGQLKQAERLGQGALERVIGTG